MTYFFYFYLKLFLNILFAIEFILQNSYAAEIAVVASNRFSLLS